MSIWKRLANAWKALRAAETVRVDSDSLPQLAGRVAALEDVQTRRELEWAETKSALDRMLKRAAALDQRARERNEGEANGKLNRQQLREVMRQKGYLKGE
jgi:hypothetical protein